MSVLQALLTMRDELGWKVVIAHPYTNLCGMVAVGALPGLEPGQVLRQQASAGILPYAPESIDFTRPRKVVYLIGETPSEELPPCDYLIYQNALPSGSARQPDLILPPTLFTESAGTTINAEGRILHLHQAVTPLEDVKPDWWILSRIAEKLGKGKPKYASVSAIQKEMKKQVKSISDSRKRVEFERISYPGKEETGTKKRSLLRAGTETSKGTGALDSLKSLRG